MTERLFLNHTFVHNGKRILKSTIAGYDILEDEETGSIAGYDIETDQHSEIEAPIYGTSDDLAVKDLIEIMAEVIGRLAARIIYIEKKLEIKAGDAEHEKFCEKLESEKKRDEEGSKVFSSFLKLYKKQWNERKEQK